MALGPYHSPQIYAWGGERKTIFSVLTFDQNIVISENTYNGNPNVTEPASAFEQYWSTDGLSYFSTGGNYFVARNTIQNNYLEAVYHTSGPAAVVQNDFGTHIHNSANKAFAGANVTTVDQTLTEDTRDNMLSFVGNRVSGVGIGWASRFGGTENNLYPLRATFCGNDIALSDPWDPGPSEGDRAAGVFQRTEFLNAWGNTLQSGYKGIVVDSEGTVHSLIVNNNLSNATQGGIFDSSRTPGGYSVIAQNVLNSGLSYHILVDPARINQVFVLKNTFLNETNSVTAIYDPLSPQIHLVP